MEPAPPSDKGTVPTDLADEPTLATLIDAEAWAEVADSLRDARSPREAWLRTLARNLDAIRSRRPTLYATLRDAIGDDELVAVDETTRGVDERIASAFEHFDLARKSGHCVGIVGIGDAAIVRAMARFAPPLTLGRQQAVLVVEPELSRVIDALGRTDLTGERGPIEQLRFGWFVGAGWARQLADELVARPTNMYPQAWCWGGEERPELQNCFDPIAADFRAAMAEWRASNEAHYADVDDAAMVALFGPTPPRRPRMLMITSQFTAVLQHSTNDSADAMRKLGWDVRIVTESEPWHAVSPPAIEAAIAEFRPDCVFQIDHLRYEFGDSIPKPLPFICWIQDHLTNLTQPVAGESIGPRDFVLTGGVYKYAERHGYPRRQCVDMAKVSREPNVPESWDEDGEDLLYVSHWSQTPESILAETTRRLGEIGGDGTKTLFRAAASAMAALYARGGSMRLDMEVRDLVRSLAAADGCDLATDAEQFLVDVLFQRLNNAFYRQQALTWAGRIADARGLRFGIYGLGWEKHPTLGRFARGAVQYGPTLESLTRRSKILLQLEPYACFTHQRMLDALLAGGFALVRSHPMNTLAVKVRTFLDAHLPPGVTSIAAARRVIAPEAREAFESLLREARMFDAMGDVVDIVRGWHRAGILGDESTALPHLGQIEFDSFEQLDARVAKFLGDREARRTIADDQRARVRDRLTYTSALGRAMKRIHGLLAESFAPATRTLERKEAA